jgi:hypothetical protein
MKGDAAVTLAAGSRRGRDPLAPRPALRAAGARRPSGRIAPSSSVMCTVGARVLKPRSE